VRGLLHRIWFEQAWPLLGVAAGIEVVAQVASPPIDGSTGISVAVGLVLVAAVARRSRPAWYVLTALSGLGVGFVLVAEIVRYPAGGTPFDLQPNLVGGVLGAVELLALLSPAVRGRARIGHATDGDSVPAG
jgi:hypothetical protein